MNPQRGCWATNLGNPSPRKDDIHGLVDEFLLLATESELLALTDRIAEIGSSKTGSNQEQRLFDVTSPAMGEIYF